MARLLDFSQYIGGADNVIVFEAFKTSSKIYSYDFDTSTSGWVFNANYRTILVDQVAYDRQTGQPNFSDSSVIGYYDNLTEITGINNPGTGIVDLTIPANRYAGTILPDSRNRVPITVVTFNWDDGDHGVQNHRYCILERWSSEVEPGDPSLDVNFIPMGVGAVTAFNDNATANVTRATVTDETSEPVTFDNVSGLTSGEGTGAQFQIIVETDGDITANITNRGTGYNAGDTIEILDSDIGGSGAPNVTVTISSVA